MTFTCTIFMDSAAFDPGNPDDPHAPVYELALCLRRIELAVEQGRTAGSVLDTNGNYCGKWEVES